MIRQRIFCDICEFQHGEESPEAEIQKPRNAPAFPQLIWTFYKLGSEIISDPVRGLQLVQRWQGGSNKFEFCGEHAAQLNVLIKRFAAKDTRLMALLDELKSEDDLDWSKKQDEIHQNYKDLKAMEGKNADGD